MSTSIQARVEFFYKGVIDNKLVKIFDARPDNVLFETENSAIRTIDVQIKIEAMRGRQFRIRGPSDLTRLRRSPRPNLAI